MARTSRKIQQKSINLMQWRVGIYVRLSVEDARKQNSGSMQTQRALVEQYVEGIKYASVYNIYEDVNCTGTNFNRPAFLRMMEDIKTGRVNCIAVKDLSRLGRNYLETGQLLEYTLPFYNVRFISVTDGYDSAQAKGSDGLIMPIQNLIHELYVREISRKTAYQYKVKREKGEFCGSKAPYGYLVRASKLEIDIQSEWVVRQIFAWYLQDIGELRIANQLNVRKIRPPKSSIKWHKSAVHRILTNPVYMGDTVGGRYARSVVTNAQKVEIITVRQTHEALISQVDFDRAMQLRAQKSIKQTAEMSVKNA